MFLVGSIITLIGSLFLFLGGLGVLRMPDSFNRIQAGTKATTLGTIFFLLGIGIGNPEYLSKIVVLILFIVFTNPVSSHVLARAAHKIKEPMAKSTVIDRLKEDEEA